MRHMYNNFKGTWSGKELDCVWATARAFIRKDFETPMEVIKKHDEDAYAYLMIQDPQTWSRYAFVSNTKNSMLLNNV